MTPTNVHQRSAAFQRCIEDRDVTAAEDILDDDYSLVLVHPAPAVIPKARWIAMLPDYIVHGYDVLDSVTAIDGDCATMFHRARRAPRYWGSIAAVCSSSPTSGAFAGIAGGSGADTRHPSMPARCQRSDETVNASGMNLDVFVELESQVWDALRRGDAEEDTRLLAEDFLGVYPVDLPGDRITLDSWPTADRRVRAPRRPADGPFRKTTSSSRIAPNGAGSRQAKMDLSSRCTSARSGLDAQANG